MANFGISKNTCCAINYMAKIRDHVHVLLETTVKHCYSLKFLEEDYMFSVCISIQPISTLRLKFISDISIFKADPQAEKYP